VTGKSTNPLHWLWHAYLALGCAVASISMMSTIYFYGIGPGAVWEIGLVASTIGFIILHVSVALSHLYLGLWHIPRCHDRAGILAMAILSLVYMRFHTRIVGQVE